MQHLLKSNNVFGVLLIMMGLLFSSSALIEFLRAEPLSLLQQDLLKQLLLGATLFKVGLVILGMMIIAIGKTSIWETANGNETPRQDPDTIINRIILTALLATAFAARLYDLDNGLWYDEIKTYIDYAVKPFGDIITTFDTRNQHFLYSVLARASLMTFGESAWSLRLPAALFGVGSIWALYLFGRQVCSDRETLLSAALLTFSYHHIWFSQNARGYSALLFWTLISSYFFIRALREARPQLWIFYAISAALGAYTQMIMIFIIIAHFMIFLSFIAVSSKYKRSEIYSGFFMGFCLAGLFTFQCYSLVLPQFLGLTGEGASTLAGGAEKSAIHSLSILPQFIAMIRENLTYSVGGFAAICSLLIFIVGVFSYLRRAPLIGLIMFLPALVSSIILVSMGHWLFPRFYFFMLGFGALVIIRGTLLIGRSMSRFIHHKSLTPGVAGMFLCAALILSVAKSAPLAYAPKVDYIGAMNFLEELKEPGDAIATLGVTTTFPYREYYKLNWLEIKTADDLRSIRSKVKRLWVLYMFPQYVQFAYPDVMMIIKQDFKLIKRFHGSLGDGTIYLRLYDTSP